MHKVALIYNPASGLHSSRRKALVDGALHVLRSAGITAEAIMTTSAGSATGQAIEAIRSGFDTVIACGGDGTVHEVLQGLVGTDVALGVIPLGTANALAANLGLTGPPSKAIAKLLTANPTRISVGRIQFRENNGGQGTRYFTVAAGVGPDALLMSRLDARLKRRLGYLLYMIEATRLVFTHGFPLFEVVVPANGNGGARVLNVSQLLAIRVRSFGGALQNLAPGASLCNGTLTSIAFKTRSRFRIGLFLAAVLARVQRFDREVELVQSPSIECRPREGSDEELFVEADGEVLGQLPMKLEVVPNSLTLLVPEGAQP
jgi:YegS/Rv2252/BmrU family lipid kinase